METASFVKNDTTYTGNRVSGTPSPLVGGVARSFQLFARCPYYGFLPHQSTIWPSTLSMACPSPSNAAPPPSLAQCTNEHLSLHVTDTAVRGAEEEQGGHAHVLSRQGSVRDARRAWGGHPCRNCTFGAQATISAAGCFCPRRLQTGIKNGSDWNDLLLSPKHVVE